ncbi:hypothetical protein SPBRAN_189 [uncultured Candidatus Thioglobus sp.]|nr:hypothetical protein SPBRAN_189 [uncultured Candidatus Thioglobus sp.]
MNNSALLIFTRAPIPGQTKTRLIPLLGAQGAAEFHQTTLRKTLAHAIVSNYKQIEIWYDGERNHPFLKKCSLDFNSTLHTQQGENLGEKMHHAIQNALKKNTLVTLIGSDCPALTADILNQAYTHLSCSTSVTLGPTQDGGYYLIGMHQANAAIFQGINWGENTVIEQTRKNLAKAGIEHIELATLADIDTPKDYQQYMHLVAQIA